MELIHSDICKPLEETLLGEARFVLTFVDDFSGMVFTHFLQTKNEVKTKFVESKTLQNKLKAIKKLSTYNGTE